MEKQLDEGSFLQVPGESSRPDKSDRPETTMITPPVIQTPLNEEKGLKRNREGATTSARATSQTYAETCQTKR